MVKVQKSKDKINIPCNSVHLLISTDNISFYSETYTRTYRGYTATRYFII